jgi:hypothetical protein
MRRLIGWRSIARVRRPRGVVRRGMISLLTCRTNVAFTRYVGKAAKCIANLEPATVPSGPRSMPQPVGLRALAILLTSRHSTQRLPVQVLETSNLQLGRWGLTIEKMPHWDTFCDCLCKLQATITEAMLLKHCTSGGQYSEVKKKINCEWKAARATSDMCKRNVSASVHPSIAKRANEYVLHGF